MTSQSLALIRSANSRISNLLSSLPGPLQSGGGPPVNLAGIQKQLAAISALVAGVGQNLRPPQTFDLEARVQVEAYAANLERLKSFILSLQLYAGAERHRLAERGGQVKEALAWCASLQLTAPKC